MIKIADGFGERLRKVATKPDNGRTPRNLSVARSVVICHAASGKGRSMARLTGKAAFVTGAAGGIGKGITLALAPRGRHGRGRRYQ